MAFRPVLPADLMSGPATPPPPESPPQVVTGQSGTGGLGFLDQVHPIYTAWKDRWRTNEILLAGGDDVLDYLRRFDWEKDETKDGAYAKRQDESIYLNFPDMYAGTITGHLLRFAPRPDFGALGSINRERDPANPTQAELIWYNTDTPGDSGTEWDTWWMDVTRRSMATGHRWLYCEGPEEDALTMLREQQGYRPYLVEFSPLDVPMWYFNRQGRLEFAIIRFNDYNPRRTSSGDMQVYSAQQQHYLLVVRAGCWRLGEQFSEGGWWTFNPDKELLDHETFADTFGEIPMWPHFYQRHKGTRKRAALSRPGLTEIGACALANMNILSAANFNAWAAGMGVEYLLGVDDEGLSIAQEMRDRGDRLIAVPPNEDTGTNPTIQGSAAGAVPAEVYKSREEAIWSIAKTVGVIEATSSVSTSATGQAGPGQTGAAKQASFIQNQVPRIVHVAQNLANSQNQAIFWLELRFGYMQPKGSVDWPNQFELVELVDRIESFFNVQKVAGINSITLDAEAMVKFAEEKGLITSDEERATFLAEFMQSGKLARQLMVQQNQPKQSSASANKSNTTKQQSQVGPGKNPGGGPGNAQQGTKKVTTRRSNATITVKRDAAGKIAKLKVRR